jgi:hypothetical protein
MFLLLPRFACQGARHLQLKVLFGDFGSIRDEAGLFDTCAEHGTKRRLEKTSITSPMYLGEKTLALCGPAWEGNIGLLKRCSNVTLYKSVQKRW